MFNCWERKKKTTKPQKNITMKFQNIRDKEKTLKPSREMRSHRKTGDQIGISLSTAVLEATKQCLPNLEGK